MSWVMQFVTDCSWGALLRALVIAIRTDDNELIKWNDEWLLLWYHIYMGKIYHGE